MRESSTAPSGDGPQSDLNWLAGGGEMGALIRAMDWSATPLGPPEGWPQSLRTTKSAARHGRVLRLMQREPGPLSCF